MGLEASILRTAEHSYDKGKNLFPAKNAGASVALFMLGVINPKKADQLRSDANDAIMVSLAKRGAVAEIYTYADINEGTGGASSLGSEVVRVMSRANTPTHMPRHGEHPARPAGQALIIRAETHPQNGDQQ